MTIAASVQDCLAREGVHYDMIAHERTRDSSHSAHAAHIPGDRLAKCVMLEDDNGYLMAVVPASHKVDLGAVHRQLNRELGLATDRELVDIYFEAGDHQSLVHVSGSGFLKLMANAPRGQISYHA
jgi:Ala-tRNA(Pro) deacylase